MEIDWEPETYAILFAAISSIAAMLAAVISWLQTRAAKTAGKASLFLAFSDRYNSTAMDSAFFDLITWREQHGEAFVSMFEKKWNVKSPDAIKVNDARRLVNRYYGDVVRALRYGLIDYRFSKSITP